MGGVKEMLYPGSPGFKEPTTSRDAAERIRGRAANLRERLLDAIRKAGDRGLTADEAAEQLGETVLAARPRITELKELKKIERTGHRRANVSGALAHCWRIKSTTQPNRGA